MANFTPGPWKVIGPIGFIFTEGDPYGCGEMHVAQVRGWGHLTGRGGGCAFDDEKAVRIQSANARLIAAAPDLLDALNGMIGLIQLIEAREPDLKHNHRYIAALEAIEKAVLSPLPVDAQEQKG